MNSNVAGLLQLLGSPLVQADTCHLCRCTGPCMHFGGHAQQHAARERLVRRQAQFFAVRHIVVHGFMKSGFEFIDAAAMKTHNIANARQVADKNAVFVIKFNAGAAGGRAPSGKR